MAEYDSIAKAYASTGDHITRKYITTPSFLEMVGDVESLSAIDLACGNGIYTRELKRLGASEVLGVDESEEMIKLARLEEEKSPLGIDYVVHDVTDLPVIGAFDIATAVYLLHYSRTKIRIRKMCEGVYRNLKPGGCLVCINLNPNWDPSRKLDSKYATTVEILPSKRREGRPIRITVHNRENDAPFTNYQWKKETYEKILDDSGFSDIEWVPAIVSDEGIEKYGERFWRQYLDNPRIVGIRCVK